MSRPRVSRTLDSARAIAKNFLVGRAGRFFLDGVDVETGREGP